MLTLGIDSGSTTTKGALFDGEKVVRTAILPTSANPKESIGRLYQMLYNQDVAYTVSTGYGRELLDQADKQITEITCHARGAAFLNPNVRAVVDIGGQDCKAILLDNGLNVVDFIMNDKCAAGTGRFIEVMMRILEEDINNIDQFVQGHQPINITSMCTVFAESEIVSLLAKGADKGAMLLRLGRQFGVRREDLCAVGDHRNDLPMLKAAGRAFAPANAVAEVRALPGITVVRSAESHALQDVVARLAHERH